MKDKIRKICEQHFPIATVKAKSESDIPKSKMMETIINHEVNKVIDEAATQIIDQLIKALPEERDVTKDYPDSYAFKSGYNAALTEVKQLLLEEGHE